MAQPTVAVRMSEAQLLILLDAMEGYHIDHLTPAETEAFDHMLQRIRTAHERVTKKAV